MRLNLLHALIATIRMRRMNLIMNIFPCNILKPLKYIKLAFADDPVPLMIINEFCQMNVFNLVMI